MPKGANDSYNVPCVLAPLATLCITLPTMLDSQLERCRLCRPTVDSDALRRLHVVCLHD